MKTLPELSRYATILSCCVGLSACQEAPEQTTPLAPAPMNRQQQIKTEANSDAQLAIGRQDFRLLALRNKGTSIPGVDLEKNELARLEQQCGLLFMQHSGDEILQRSELILRQEQYIYALIYNKLVLPVCLAKNQ